MKLLLEMAENIIFQILQGKKKVETENRNARSDFAESNLLNMHYIEMDQKTKHMILKGN